MTKNSVSSGKLFNLSFKANEVVEAGESETDELEDEEEDNGDDNFECADERFKEQLKKALGYAAVHSDDDASDVRFL